MKLTDIKTTATEAKNIYKKYNNKKDPYSGNSATYVKIK